jgi:hypothetical protein
MKRSNHKTIKLGAVLAVAADQFPATGQTTVYRAGDDGDIQAGATLRYKDNGDGTITDKNTNLTWEKKSDDKAVNDNTTFPHDKDNTYTWDDAFDVHVFTLNNICANDETVDCSVNGDADCAGVGGKCGFAGKRDWRVPNVKELQSIANYQNVNPSVSSAFNTNCVAGATVLTGSCTAASDYWSSTTDASFSGFAWLVDFGFGNVGAGDKIFNFHVRAVRGGSP